MSMNNLKPIYYRVTIDGTSFGDGFIDNTTPVVYAETGDYPSTLAASYKKAAANIRWQEIIHQVSANISPIMMDEIVKGGTPDNDTAPTSISFTIGYDREEYVYTHNVENSPSGVEILKEEAAIKRQVARAMLSDVAPGNNYFYDPTIVNNGKTGNPIGPVIYPVGADKLTNDLATAETAITVAKIENV